MNKMICELSKYQVVSFDIFDTLLVRNTNNAIDIFKVVQSKCKKKLGSISNNFVCKRKEAALVAAKNALNGEANIDDIYKYLEGYSNAECAYLKKMELIVEKEFLQKNNKVYEIYDWCMKNNKRVIALSDMYLPAVFLKDILRKNDIFCEDIFVSCELKQSKRNGKIFKIIEKKIGVDPNSIIHIGDSFVSDYLQPKKAGWSSLYIKKSRRDDLLINLKRNIIATYIANNENEKDFFLNCGIKILGPILFEFSVWLHNCALRNDVESLLFFSRDGKIIEEAYHILFKDSIKTDYFHVSRRALNTAALWMHTDFDELKNYIIVTKTFTINNFLKRIGLNADKYVQLLSENNLDGNSVYSDNDFWKDNRIRLFYHSILADVIENSREQYNLFVNYFKMFFSGKHLGIVDIGWRGSMQNRLCEIVSNIPGFEKTEIDGFYMGIENSVSNMHGYLYETKERTRNRTTIDAGVGLFEVLFLAREGTTLSYEEKNGKAHPVLDEYELNDSEVNQQIKKIHDGALTFINAMKEMGVAELGNSDQEFAMKNLEQFVYKPQDKQLEEISKLSFEDTENVPLIEAKGLLFYLKNPLQLKIDYHKSLWKIGFLKYNLGKCIPWGWVYQILKNKSFLNKFIRR